jgi:predicted GNAT family N-acyltransferase
MEVEEMMRVMASEDLDGVLRLTNAAGWAYESSDLERLARLAPEGCIVSEEDGVVVAFASALRFGKVGVIGNVVVDQRLRGKGMGRAVVEAARATLAGTEGVRLHSYIQVRDFYERFGFVAGQRFVTMRGRASLGCVAGEVEELGAGTMREVLALDASLSGMDRSRLLKVLCAEFPDMALVAPSNDGIGGYLFARGSRTSGYEVGPWASVAGAGDRLLAAFLGRVEEGAEVWATVRKGDERAVAILAGAGFATAFETVEMAFGQTPPAPGDALLAICGLEKG